MAERIEGRRVAILATDGFEESELTKPHEALKDAGAHVEIVSLESGKIKSWAKKDWGDKVKVDKTVDSVSVDDYDALVIPGGQINPDLLRANDDAVRFVRDFVDAGKPVAAICHGPWLLVEADVIRNRRATSYHSIKTDMRNAGAQWVDEEVVNDNGIITSRKPDDIPAFNEEIIRVLQETPAMAV